MEGVALRLARIDDVPACDPVVDWLGPGERARLAGMGSELRRRAFVGGRWLLRQMLAEHVGGAPAAQAVDIDDAGRTHCTPGCFASLSHSGDWLACALADAPIGVDIERADRARADLGGLAEMVNGPAQCAELVALSEQRRLRRFYQLWTLKEAALKREGLGLDFARMRLMRFEPDVAGEALSVELGQPGLMLALVGSGALRLRERPASFVLAEPFRLVEAG